MRRNIKNNQDGFTLTELLVVIAIIGILAAAGVPLLFSNINKARISDFESDFQTVKMASIAYYSDHDSVATEFNQLDPYIENMSKSPLGGNYKLRSKKAVDGYQIISEGSYPIEAFSIDSNGKVKEEVRLDSKGDVFFSVQGVGGNEIYLTNKQFKKLIDDIGAENIYISSEPGASKYQFVELYIRVMNNVLPEPSTN